jgi:hypothetical protein
VNKTTGVSPTFIGPIFVHTEKNFEAYHHFFSTLVKLEPKLLAIRAVGTNGEQALINAILAVFPEDIVHLRCFIHARDNICRKLTDMLLPESVRNVVLRDIFGTQQGTVYINGLVDACDAKDYDRRLVALKEKWKFQFTPPEILLSMLGYSATKLK